MNTGQLIPYPIFIVRFSEWGRLLLSFFSWSPKFGIFSVRSDGLALSGIAWRKASFVGNLVVGHRGRTTVYQKAVVWWLWNFLNHQLVHSLVHEWLGGGMVGHWPA